MNSLAEELNNIIKENNTIIYDLLSEKGKNIFYPTKGILAQAKDAKSKKINATIGSAFEEDGTPMRLHSIENKINLDPKLVFPYAPSFGRDDLRRHWKTMQIEKNPILKNKNISLPVVSNALTHGLSILGYLFINNNDDILLPNYFWGNYKLAFINAYNANLVTFNMFLDNGFDLKSFDDAIKNSKKDKLTIILNFPNNPTGFSPSVIEVQKIVSILKKNAEAGKKLTVISDDAYYGLFFENEIENQSIFSYLCDLHENILAVKIDGATKEDYVWGFRVGFITFGIKNGNETLYNALEQKTAGAIRGNISNVTNISQSILFSAYNDINYQNEKKSKYNILKKRYQLVKKILSSKNEYLQYFNPLPFNSGYFMCIKLKDNLNGELVRQKLLNNYNTGVINIGNLLRIAFSAVPINLIEELFDNIYNACKEVAKD